MMKKSKTHWINRTVCIYFLMVICFCISMKIWIHWNHYKNISVWSKKRCIGGRRCVLHLYASFMIRNSLSAPYRFDIISAAFMCVDMCDIRGQRINIWHMLACEVERKWTLEHCSLINFYLHFFMFWSNSLTSWWFPITKHSLFHTKHMWMCPAPRHLLLYFIHHYYGTCLIDFNIKL